MQKLLKASMIVCDRGYLRHQRAWRKVVAENSVCPVVQVETDVVIPVEQVSDKAEYAAYTIRPKISRQLDQYLIPIERIALRNPSLEISLKSTGLDSIKTVLRYLNVDDSIPPVSHIFRGGTSEAKARFDLFLDQHLLRYTDHRNEPKYIAVSCMSPYLHFGQISPLYLALKIKACKNGNHEAEAVYLEELIVRRELAANFVYFNPYYDSLGCLPAWPKKTLADHEKDARDPVYSKSQLIECRTHDEYWNAAMKEMIVSGFMHNYMRMYWGKKILEWSPTPEIAYETMIDLNNAYFLDGRDPNSYAGVGWIFGRQQVADLARNADRFSNKNAALVVIGSVFKAVAALKQGHRQGSIQGNTLQLGGAVVIDVSGAVRYFFEGAKAGDHPEINDLLRAVEQEPSI